MTNKKYHFEFNIPIPVPLGTTVYTFWTDCGNACAFQKRDPQLIKCSRESPCHTKKKSVTPVTLGYDNLKTILDGWNVFYFRTSKEAEEAGNMRVAHNIQTMRELGYAVDDDGSCVNAMTEAQAREYNKTHFKPGKKVINFLGKTFREAYLAGEVNQDDIHDYVEYWHTHETDNELHEFLGMTAREYSKWAFEDELDLED